MLLLKCDFRPVLPCILGGLYVSQVRSHMHLVFGKDVCVMFQSIKHRFWTKPFNDIECYPSFIGQTLLVQVCKKADIEPSLCIDQQWV